jgi:hypothetical protein
VEGDSLRIVGEQPPGSKFDGRMESIKIGDFSPVPSPSILSGMLPMLALFYIVVAINLFLFFQAL